VSYPLPLYRDVVTNIRAHWDGDVWLLIAEDAQPAILALLQEYNIKIIKTIERGGERASDAWNRINRLRWLFYQDQCQLYDLCMALDFRDTLFQLNPFAEMTGKQPRDVLYLYEHNLEMNAWHLGQAKQCGYGQYNQAMRGKPIINAGGFAASPHAMAQLVKFLKTAGVNGCDDQVALNIGVYNDLIFENSSTAVIHTHKQGEGSINNVGWGGEFRRDTQGRFLNRNCLLAPVVHSYDKV
jgi:hypothetical protein